uniref:Osteoclast-stimulating factor 1 n=1 Tax=Cyclopterus lumpus TaxID=8103 RepID=A0A8C2Z5X8_CYCLU
MKLGYESASCCTKSSLTRSRQNKVQVHIYIYMNIYKCELALYFINVCTSGNWYTAELNGREGLVPKNFININLPSWYREDFSRGDAEEKLMQQPVGAFLLRGSRKAVLGDFSISVRHPENVQHFKVLRDSRGRYYLWSEKFPSLNQLVEYYKHNSISIESQMVLLETPHLVRTCCEALYSFHAEEMDELTFNAGDVILVLERSDRAWWRGRVGGRTGLFPSNYTQPV